MQPAVCNEFKTLCVSLVTFEPNHAMLRDTLDSLFVALEELCQGGCWCAKVCLIDNSKVFALEWLGKRYGSQLECVHGHGNIGFGRAHNRCVHTPSNFHLVLNPDVELSPDALRLALGFMAEFPQCGLLSPAATWGDGSEQALCKRYPSVFDLLLRGFAPEFLRHVFRHRLAAYEMQDAAPQAVIWSPTIVSGCFMLLRSDVFRKVGGFDERFFLYFEDFDLSLRVAQHAQLASVSAVKLVHHGGHSAKKGAKHIWLFARSAYLFYCKHGWRLW